MKSKKGRYWIFSFDSCYPSGGMNDFRFSFNNLQEFEDGILEVTGYDVYQVLDTESNYHFKGDIGTITKWVCKNTGEDTCEGD